MGFLKDAAEFVDYCEKRIIPMAIAGRIARRDAMADKKKDATTDSIQMVILPGLLLIGRLIGGNKLLKPRVFTMFDKEEIDNTGKRVKVPQIQMAPLPGTPPFYMLNGNEGRYPVPVNDHNRSIFELYERVTSPQVDPGI
jgi:hypothetical protein